MAQLRSDILKATGPSTKIHTSKDSLSEYGTLVYFLNVLHSL